MCIEVLVVGDWMDFKFACFERFCTLLIGSFLQGSRTFQCVMFMGGVFAGLGNVSGDKKETLPRAKSISRSNRYF